MNEWLTVIIVLLIIGVILDGVRRMRQARRDSLRMNLDTNMDADGNDLQDYSNELPNGGARVANRQHEKQAEYLNSALQNAIKNHHSSTSKPSPTDQQTLNLEDNVPMLMDSVPAEAKLAAGKLATNQVVTNQVVTEKVTTNKEAKNKLINKVEPRLGEELQTAAELKFEERPEPAGAPVEEESQLSKRRLHAKKYPTQEPSNPQLSSKQQPSAKQSLQKNPFKKLSSKIPSSKVCSAKTLSLPEPKTQPEEVLILHIESAGDEYFHGGDLLKLVLSQGLRYGDMNIFHRHTEENGEGPVLFSMANMVMPGTFDLNAFDTLITPGVSVFLRLPMADYNSIKAFEMMLVTAKALADQLGGEVKDEQHSVMTRQTVEHYRERIRNFSLKQQLLERA